MTEAMANANTICHVHHIVSCCVASVASRSCTGPRSCLRIAEKNQIHLHQQCFPLVCLRIEHSGNMAHIDLCVHCIQMGTYPPF
jgi:hypothetical protein